MCVTASARSGRLALVDAPPELITAQLACGGGGHEWLGGGIVILHFRFCK